MEKFKKIDKEFRITDDSLNVYKYRCLTSGLQLDEFKKNPVGFYMHKRDDGAVARWEDFRIEGDSVFAKPVINLSHPQGQRILDEIDNGFLNGASVGKIVVLEASNDAALKVSGQKGPTVTKWYPREISLVDIPGNYNALASLCDAQGNDLDLADFVNSNNPNMKNVLLAASILTALNLTDKSEQGDIESAINDLIDRAEKGDKAVQDLADMTQNRDALKTELEALEASVKSQRVQDLIAAGKADKKLTVELGNHLAAQYKDNPEGLQDLIDKMQPQLSVLPQEDEQLADLKDATWDSLYVSGKLEEVKTKFPNLYDKLRNEKFSS